MITPSSARGSIRALLLAVTFCWTLVAAAQVQVPPLKGHVTDQTGTLTAEQKASLEQTLSAFEARKGSQLAVLVLTSTAPEAIEQYALSVAEQGKHGRRNVDDGAILVVAKDDRTLRFEVGYGLEAALNELTSKRIISESILPRFKQQDFYGGIAAGGGQIIRVIDGESLPEPSMQPVGSLGTVTRCAQRRARAGGRNFSPAKLTVDRSWRQTPLECSIRSPHDLKR
ncbi:YgcG family protein [Rhodoferax sp.]|uniref:TPM domain-containing protein n=1 Tax=Rhodoferax sp. TaxID=50421 RepID=UPI00351D5D50